MSTTLQAGVTVAPVTPMSLIEMAAARGASIEQMAQLFELKLRVEANESKKAYNEAFSAFKAESIAIVKNVAVNDGPLKGKRYADLFGVVNVVTPVLSKHGLSHAWKLTKDEPGWMEVTCTITHVSGHSESVSMGAGPDTGPGRNAIQARASAKTYLERYTLLAATGMAASNTDDDGRGAGKAAGLPESEIREACELMKQAGGFESLKHVFGSAYKRAKEIKDHAAMADLTTAYNEAKAALA